MMTIDREFWVCQCCLFALVNGDACDCDDDHAARVVRGVERVGAHAVPSFDSDTGEGIREFSWSACECCGSGLGGSRHKFSTLVPIAPGLRVALSPSTDAWMRGDRYGEVVRVGRTYVHVRMDRSGRTLRVTPRNVAGVVS